VDDQPESPRTLNDRIVASLGVGVLVVDARGEPRLANSRARALLGEPATGEGAAVGEATAVRTLLAAVADLSGDGWKEVVVVVAGEPRVLGVRAATLERDGTLPGERPEKILTLTDLTEARATEAAARRVATLAGVSRLTHHVAHELKNPLGALKLYTLLLERHLRGAKPDSRDLAEKVGRAIDHLTAVVGDVTAFGAAGTVERKPVALAPLLDECVAAATERVSNPGIEVVRRFEPDLGVRGDVRLLRQAVRAFIDNAVQAMADGGTLTVSAARGDGETVGITVEDSGPGLPPGDRAQIFEPFFTTRPDKVGLGATIAGHIIEQHGGRVVVCSEPTVGTTIRIVLPAD
jgi:signal transduction histidine kinase